MFDVNIYNAEAYYRAADIDSIEHVKELINGITDDFVYDIRRYENGVIVDEYGLVDFGDVYPYYSLYGNVSDSVLKDMFNETAKSVDVHHYSVSYFKECESSFSENAEIEIDSYNDLVSFIQKTGIQYITQIYAHDTTDDIVGMIDNIIDQWYISCYAHTDSLADLIEIYKGIRNV